MTNDPTKPSPDVLTDEAGNVITDGQGNAIEMEAPPAPKDGPLLDAEGKPFILGESPLA